MLLLHHLADITLLLGKEGRIFDAVGKPKVLLILHCLFFSLGLLTVQFHLTALLLVYWFLLASSNCDQVQELFVLFVRLYFLVNLGHLALNLRFFLLELINRID